MYKYPYIHTYIHTSIHTNIHTYIQYIHTSIHTYTKYTYIQFLHYPSAFGVFLLIFLHLPAAIEGLPYYVPVLYFSVP